MCVTRMCEKKRVGVCKHTGADNLYHNGFLQKRNHGDSS